VRARSRSPVVRVDGMNGLEFEWSACLNLIPDVRRWVFEGTRLRLAKGVYYTPDFTVFMSDGLIEMHECKGHMREAARVRLRTAAEVYPEFLFKLIRRPKRSWEIEPITGSGADPRASRASDTEARSPRK